jgi:hypothetical protein
MSGPGSPRAPGAGGGICSFVSCHVRDLVGGVGNSAMPVGRGSVKEPPSLGCWGRWVLARPLARTRGGAKDQTRAVIDWEPGALVSPLSPEQRPRACLDFAQSLARTCTRVFLRGIVPEPPSDPGRFSWGSFGQKTLTPGLKISLCLSLISQGWGNVLVDAQTDELGSEIDWGGHMPVDIGPRRLGTGRPHRHTWIDALIGASAMIDL